MSHAHEIAFVVAAYEDLRAASRGYQAINDLYYETNELDRLDAVVVGRQDTGEPKLSGKPDLSATYASWPGAEYGLAAGLVLALVPDAAIGTRVHLGPGACAGLRAVGSHVGRGVGCLSLEEFGEWLETSRANLVVAVSADLLDRVRTTLSTDDQALTACASIDIQRLTGDAHAAQLEVTRDMQAEA